MIFGSNKNGDAKMVIASPEKKVLLLFLKPGVYSSVSSSSSIFMADTGIRVPGPKMAATPAL